MLNDAELIQHLKDTFQIGYEAFESSDIESLQVWDLYHNRQYSEDQLAKLSNRGQPAETFNVIKLFARMTVGYYSTVVNTIIARPTQVKSIPNAQLISDTIAYELRTNNFETTGDDIKLTGLLSGLLICYRNAVKTGKVDRFGRPLYKMEIESVPDSECVLDPGSRKKDYSDSKFFHRFKWVLEDDINDTYGKKTSDKIDEYNNYLTIDEAEFEYSYNGQFTGRYKVHNNYLVTHSIVKLADGTTWSVHWCDETVLFKKQLKNPKLQSHYTVEKLHTSNRSEYYGIFREVVESQHAINQALIKMQLMANSQKTYVEDGAVEDLDEFKAAVNRVSGVIEVKDLAGIKVENLSKDVLEQYAIIDKAFDRVQRILGINDSFLGNAFASDSGRKVKLQQNATIISMGYLTKRIQSFYQNLGRDLATIISQYWTAEQALLLTDEVNNDRWVELNKPVQLMTGETDPQTGQPIMEYAYEMVPDPETGEPMLTKEGEYVIAPIPEEETEIQYTDVEIAIDSTAYNDEDEKNQLLMETVLAGPAGKFMQQVNPAGYFKIYGMSIKSMKTKNTPEIANIFAQTADMLGGDPAQQEEAKMIAQGNGPGSGASQVPLSQDMKLPANTNEGVG